MPRSAGLLVDIGTERRINLLALHEFLQHGIRYLLPGEVGAWRSGLPTAHSAEPLLQKLLGESDPVVMPLREGPMRGRAPANATWRQESCCSVCKGRKPPGGDRRRGRCLRRGGPPGSAQIVVKDWP